MKFTSQRLYHTKGNPHGDYSCSFVTNGEYRAFIIEDGPQAVKIKGKTRIPAGLYKLGIRKELTPLTIKHRKNYKTKWFSANPDWFHIEVLNIPNFQFVYVHSGNDDSHSEGCLLPNYKIDASALNNPGSTSLQAVDDFYSIVYPLLLKGEEVLFEIKDEL